MGDSSSRVGDGLLTYTALFDPDSFLRFQFDLSPGKFLKAVRQRLTLLAQTLKSYSGQI